MADAISLTAYRITVLLVDDQRMIGEQIRRMLSTEPRLHFEYCQNPIQAISIANTIAPTVILQDLVMPEIDGLTLVRYFRVNPATRDVPLIVLSTKEDAHIKAEAFSLGANDYMVKFPDRLEVIARICYHSQAYINLLQRNEAYEKLLVAMQEEQERIRELDLLTRMSDALQGCYVEQETYNVLANIFRELFPLGCGYIALVDDSQRMLKIIANWGELPENFPTECERDACLILHEYTRHAPESHPQKALCAYLPEEQRGYCLSEPIIAHDEVLGLVHVQCRQYRENFSDKSVQRKLASKQTIIHRMAEHYALFLVNLRLRETLRIESIHDPLTGLYNRRYMEQSLERELARAERHNTSLGIIMLDIDHFKHFNDTYGHDTGDVVLQQLAYYLQEHVRDEDIVCRYGGEEFMLILPEISSIHLAERAEKLRIGVEREVEVRRRNTRLTVTASLGVACFPEHGVCAQDVQKAADQALYQAKAEGRNRMIVSGMDIAGA